ncbi:MAG: hypothetical protein AAF502_16195 [Bacteroidota bacterium]
MILQTHLKNNFEGDLTLFNNNTPKISLLELDVILNNNLRELNTQELFPGLRLPMRLVLSFKNQFNPDFNFKDLKELNDSDIDLWEGKSDLSPERFIEIINDNLVWAEFHKMYLFSKRKYSF